MAMYSTQGLLTRLESATRSTLVGLVGESRSRFGDGSARQRGAQDSRPENQLLAAGIAPKIFNWFIEPHNRIQGNLRDFYASKGFMFSAPRLQAEYGGRFTPNPRASEAQIQASMTAAERAWHQSMFDERSRVLNAYLAYKAENPIAASDMNSVELLPGSNEKKLAAADIALRLQGVPESRKADALELMQKEIEAKSGRQFLVQIGNDAMGWPELDCYFSRKTWYQPTYIDGRPNLNEAAKANMELLIAMERSYRGLT